MKLVKLNFETINGAIAKDFLQTVEDVFIAPAANHASTSFLLLQRNETSRCPRSSHYLSCFLYSLILLITSYSVSFCLSCACKVKQLSTV